MADRFIIFDKYERKWLRFGIAKAYEGQAIIKGLNASARGQRHRFMTLFGPDHSLWRQFYPYYLNRYGSLP